MAYIQAKKFFAHGAELRIKIGNKEIRRPFVLTYVVMNALVPRGTMLLIGPPGSGKTTLVKTLGVMMTSMKMSEIEKSILRGHPFLNVLNAIGTFDTVSLLKSGEEKIRWRPFVDSFWKIVDEVNRLSPLMQDALLSMSAEGVVNIGGHTREVKEYVLYATLNPRDVGTYELGRAFLDRFSIAIPVTMPGIVELYEMLSRPEERLYELGLRGILTVEDLKNVQILVDKVKIPKETMFFIEYILCSLRTCVRVQRETIGGIDPAWHCEGCHYNTRYSVCKEVISTPSNRILFDLRRYSKALAWLCGLEYVPISVVREVAPYVIWHRVEFYSDSLKEHPYYGDTLKFAKDLIERIYRKFSGDGIRYMDWISRAERGEITKDDLRDIELAAKSDVVVEMHIKLAIKGCLSKKYKKYRNKVERLEHEIELVKQSGRKRGFIKEVYNLLDEVRNDTELKHTVKSGIEKDLYRLMSELTKMRVVFKLSEWRKVYRTVNDDIIKVVGGSTRGEIVFVLREALSFIMGLTESVVRYGIEALVRSFNKAPELELSISVLKINEDDEEPSIIFDIKGGMAALELGEILKRVSKKDDEV